MLKHHALGDFHYNSFQLLGKPFQYNDLGEARVMVGAVGEEDHAAG